MPAFYFKDHINGQKIHDNPFLYSCIFCKSALSHADVDDVWPVSDKKIQNSFKKTIKSYKKHHSLEDCYLNLRMETKESEVTLEYCKICGWWRLTKTFCIAADAWQIWDVRLGCVGTLSNLDLINDKLPLDEIRSFLSARYEKRFFINPRIFEGVVADVFKSIGYFTTVTGYTHDGGVDIILNNGINQIGVQVKRTKNKITIEEIRSFIGALVLSGKTKGFFITTSDFTGQAIRSSRATSKIQLDLFDSEMFSDVLSFAQFTDDSPQKLLKTIYSSVTNLSHYGFDTPYNSL